MLARRLLIVVAILMGVTALTAGLAAPPRDRAPEPSAAERETAPTSAGATVERMLEIEGGRGETVAVEEGDLLKLSVTGDVLDVVELVGLDRTAPIGPETPAEFDVLADAPGSYAIELVSTRARVGTLRVSPAEE